MRDGLDKNEVVPPSIFCGEFMKVTMQVINYTQTQNVAGGLIGSSNPIAASACGDLQISVGTGGISIEASFSQLAACFRELTGGDEVVPMYSELYWQGAGEAAHDFGDDYSGQGWTVG